jgi:hypothetical protein
VKERALYQKYKQVRQDWWRKKLGDEEFIRRRLLWLLSKGHLEVAARLAIEEQARRELLRSAPV